jgi:hypothetical protein
MCPQCGNYRGRVVVDIVQKQEARLKRREARLREMGVDTNAVAEESDETKKGSEKAEAS